MIRTCAAVIVATGLVFASATTVASQDGITGAVGGDLRQAVRIPNPANSPPATTTPPPAAPTALDVLAAITVANEQPHGYDRDLFPHWGTHGNGCDTRDQVLRNESNTPAQVSFPGCVVIAGDWYSTYDNATTSDPTDLDVEHVVALKEAWDSGAHSWTPARRQAFANDLSDSRTLAAVTSTSNAAKGAADPSNWIPPHQPAVCGYLSDWVSIKARWDLTMDQSEHGRIRNYLTANCPNQPITPTTEPVVVEPDTTACSPSYPDVCIPPGPPDLNCGDISFRDIRVIAPDEHGLDGNSDGIGCSS